jgi:hypothetical protein
MAQGESGPVPFRLSGLPAGTPLTAPVRLARLRRRIGHDHREMEQAPGLARFEGRTRNGRHHHATPVSAAHAFRTLQRPARDPRTPGAGLSLHQVVREPRTLLATWAGACPACHRDIPPNTDLAKHYETVTRTALYASASTLGVPAGPRAPAGQDSVTSRDSPGSSQK